MDFRRIRHFVHTAELGSLSRAAERLHIVQPALSQSIKRLEEELDVLLFTRSRRGMELTEAGHMFLKSAYGILNQYNRAKENISAIGTHPKGLVSVAMTASALHVLSVPVCEQIREECPGIEINLEEGLAANIQQGFEAGWYDLVISNMTGAGDSIQIEDLIEEDLFLASPYKKSTSKADIPFEKLSGLDLILPQDQHGVGASIQETADRLGVDITAAQITGAMHPTLQLVEAGFGHSLLPWSSIYDRVEQKRLSARRVVKPGICHKVSVIYPTHRPLTQATIAVMNVLRHAVMRVHAEGRWPGKLLIADRKQAAGKQPGSA